MRIFRRYAPWVFGLGTLNLVAWLTFELQHTRELTTKELWPLRLSLISGLLLLDNLIALWWYAHRTEQQAQVSDSQYRLAFAQVRQANKPLVVMDQETRLASFGTYSAYPLRNIGRGLAINVYALVWVGDKARVTSLGAIQPGGERRWSVAVAEFWPHRSIQRVKETDQRPLTDRAVLLAEGLITRTAQWTVTLNVVLPSWQVVHKTATLPTRDTAVDVDDLLGQYRDELRRQLDEFADGALSSSAAAWQDNE